METEVKGQLKAAYKQFIDEVNPVAKDAAGRNLIRFIFGNSSIAEKPVR